MDALVHCQSQDAPGKSQHEELQGFAYYGKDAGGHYGRGCGDDGDPDASPVSPENPEEKREQEKWREEPDYSEVVADRVLIADSVEVCADQMEGRGGAVVGWRQGQGFTDLQDELARREGVGVRHVEFQHDERVVSVLGAEEWFGFVEVQSGGLAQCLKSQEQGVAKSEGVCAQQRARAGCRHHQGLQSVADDLVGPFRGDFRGGQELRDGGQQLLQAGAEFGRKRPEAHLAHTGEERESLCDEVQLGFGGIIQAIWVLAGIAVDHHAVREAAFGKQRHRPRGVRTLREDAVDARAVVSAAHRGQPAEQCEEREEPGYPPMSKNQLEERHYHYWGHPSNLNHWSGNRRQNCSISRA